MPKKRQRQNKTSVTPVQSAEPIANDKDFELFRNELINRMTLAYSASGGNIGVTHGGARDLYTILGYKKELSFEDYYWRYKRQDIATRIVQAFPSACWSMKPTVSESDTPTSDTEFEKKFSQMVIKNKVYHYLGRADILAGIGRFGIVVLGFADNKKLDQPVTKKAGMRLIYMTPYHEGNVKVYSYETNTASERYGLPLMYDVATAIPEIENAMPTTEVQNNVKVHWSRVIHIIPELGGESDIYGPPRLENVYNRLQDIDSIAGGSSEMLWRGAFQGMAFKNDEGATMTPEGVTALETEINDYVNNLKRYIKLQNMEVQTLDSNVTDPKSHLDVQITLVAAGKGYPKRILVGSEAGSLASTQDETTWNKKIDERRVDHSELVILRPFIDRMIDAGVLPEPSTPYTVTWPDLYSPSGEEKAKVAEALSRALKDYLTMPEGQIVVPPKIYLQKVLGFSEKEVKQAEELVAQMSQKEIDDIMRDEEDIDENRDNNANNT